MTTATATLAEFLLARIAEDEALASEASRFVGGALGPYNIGAQAHVVRELWRHADHWTPARVLAECDAKRRMLARFRSMAEWPEFTDPDMHEPLEFFQRESAIEDGEEFLRVLALPYADHPDFREEWRP